ncbi:MAG: glycerophosphodiester phosphodiesterase [bacterium]
MSAISDLLSAPGSFVIGHRGAAGLAPENTLPSFQHALDWRCPMIELDVHLTSATAQAQDIVVIHDRKLSRTTNGTGLVADHSLAQLRLLDAGNGAGIPTLTDVFSLLQQHQVRHGQTVALNIELKGADTGPAIARWLDAHARWPVVVSSFSHRELRRFRELDNITPVAPLFDKYRKDWLVTATSLQAVGVNLSLKLASVRWVREISAAGFPVSVYTVNDPAVALQLRDRGVKGIFTDRPDLLIPALSA